MIDRSAPKAQAALRCVGIRVASEVRRCGSTDMLRRAPAAPASGLGPNVPGAHAPGRLRSRGVE